MSNMLTCHNVHKVFVLRDGSEVNAIEGLDFSIGAGEFVAVLGASGCGKSTLLNLFAGFIQPSAGRVCLRGESIEDVEPRCGMVFQSYALFPWKSVYRNVEFALKLQGCSRRTRRETVQRHIDMVDLRGFEDRYPAELSGGMQQRVALARVLAADPEVFLMDEPFAALDAFTRQVMQEELIRIHEANRKTTLFVTHNIDEALLLSDKIVILSARPGRVKAIVENVLSRPRHIDIQLSDEYLKLKSQVWREVQAEVHDHFERTKIRSETA